MTNEAALAQQGEAEQEKLHGQLDATLQRLSAREPEAATRKGELQRRLVAAEEQAARVESLQAQPMAQLDYLRVAQAAAGAQKELRARVAALDASTALAAAQEDTARWREAAQRAERRDKSRAERRRVRELAGEK